MSLYSYLQPGTFQPHLPEYCQPETDFLLRFSSTFHTCVPTRLAFASTLLGSLSIVAWLFAQLPQIWKNYTLHSTSGLSIVFLSEWLLGDLSNLLGSLFTRQATWQVVLACYYCFVDVLLVCQWIWYEKLKHGRPSRSVWKVRDQKKDDGGQGLQIQQVQKKDGQLATTQQFDSSRLMPKASAPRTIFRMPSYASPPASPSGSESEATGMPSNRKVVRIKTGASPMPSPRTVLFISMVLAVVCRASPISPQPIPVVSPTSIHIADSTAIEIAGRLLSWLSTLSYLLSRIPQLYKNHVRKSTSGLSPTLFLAAFTGNLFYSSSLLTNPSAWSDMTPHGGRGWASAEGNNRAEWLSLAAPFFFGAAGVLFMDFMVGLQFWYFGEGPVPADVSVSGEPDVVIVTEQGPDSQTRPRALQWKRADGWMRGWMPSVSVAGTPRNESFMGYPVIGGPADGESSRLLGSGGQSKGYGGTSGKQAKL